MISVHFFKRLLKTKQMSGKTYLIFVGLKEFAVPFCFLAKKNDFAVDGVVIINPAQTLLEVLPQDFSGVPIIDPNRMPFNPRQCFVVTAVFGEPLQAIRQSLSAIGINAIESLNNDHINEMFEVLQYENFIAEAVRAELQRDPLARVSIVNAGSKAQTLGNILKFSGVPVDDLIENPQQATNDSLLIMPVETPQNIAMLQALTQQNVGRVIPMFGGELNAAEQYWNAHRIFDDFFGLNDVPDFIAKFEEKIRRIMSAYDEVNITSLNVENEAQIAMACALSTLSIDKKILHVVIPLNAVGNQVNYAAGAGNVMLQSSKTRLELLTLASREFWRYFVKKQPDFVSYSKSVYDHYADRYRNEPLKLDNELITFTDGEREMICRNRAEKFLPEEMISRVVEARLLVSDNFADRWLAMLYGIPIVLINASTYTLDYKLIVRSEKSPMLMLPKRIEYDLTKKYISIFHLMNFEEQISDFNIRMQVVSQNGIKLLDNTSEEIVAAVEEMLARLNGNFEYNDEEEFMSATFKRLASDSKRKVMRDVFDGHVSINYFKNNRQLLGLVYLHRRCMSLEGMLPQVFALKSTLERKPKIKIRMIGHSVGHELTRTLYDACKEDREIDLLIITPDEKVKNAFKSAGYDAVTTDEYSIESDKPDVMLLHELWNCTHSTIGDLRKHSKLIVAAISTSALVTYAGLNIFISWTMERHYVPFKPDFYLFDSFLYNRYKSIAYFNDKTLIEMGSLKYDGIYRAVHNTRSVAGWEKLDGKKVILWSPSHGTFEDYGGVNVTSLIFYVKEVFRYMELHPNMAMVFRPHSLSFREWTAMSSYWCDDDFYSLRDYCRQSSNIVFDDSKFYGDAYAMADAVITDPYCGVVMSALPMKKPICAAFNPLTTIWCEPESLTHCYKVHSAEELIAFLDMMERGDDPMRELREQAARENVMHFDGRNGWRLKEFMKQALRDKIAAERAQ